MIIGLDLDAAEEYLDKADQAGGWTHDARFWAKVDRRDPDDCWVWTAATNRSGGYGRFRVGGRAGRMVSAHRFAYERLVGPIPDGLTIDHLCRVPRCVNPKHLEPVTVRENTLRGESFSARNARKTHCIHGHPFDEANTIHRKGGRRECRICNYAGKRRLRTPWGGSR